MTLFVGAHSLLDGRIRQVSDFGDTERPTIRWDLSHSLNGKYSDDYSGNAPICDFLPEENRRAVMETVRSFVTEPVFLEWLASIGRDESLALELYDLPFRYWELYGQSQKRADA